MLLGQINLLYNTIQYKSSRVHVQVGPNESYKIENNLQTKHNNFKYLFYFQAPMMKVPTLKITSQDNEYSEPYELEMRKQTKIEKDENSILKLPEKPQIGKTITK
jgi:hypothetical protein